MATSSIDLGLRGLHDVEVIGSGGSAVVYKAVRDVPGRFAMQETVAVKVLRSSWDSAARRRFEREQRVMDRLSETAGFVPILETGETDDGSPYIVMPFYEGGSLQRRVARSGPIEWPRAVRLVEEVAKTLEQAHELDVFHRDIKPANILLTEAGRPHVADFGISLIADDTTSKATSTAAFTPAYSPPESFTEGLLPVASTDIYGLAATLWATLAGHAPFKSPGEQPTPVTVFGRVAMHQVGDLRETVPSPICRFIERAMAKIPADRPATMAEFRAELQAAREDAYRGVEAERLEVKPLVNPASAPLFEPPSTVGDDEIAADGAGAEIEAAGADEEESSSVTLGVLPGEVPLPAADRQPDDHEPDDHDDDDEDGQADSVDEEAAPATVKGADSDWLIKVAAVALSTTAILLLTWWLLDAGSASGADDTLVIVAEGDATSESGGDNGADGGGQSQLDPVPDATLAPESVGRPPEETAPAGPAATEVTTATSPLPTTSASTTTTTRPPTSSSTVAVPASVSTSTSADPVGRPPDESGPLTDETGPVAAGGEAITDDPSPSSTDGGSFDAPVAIEIVRPPGVVSSTGSDLVFSYRTNEVCGTGSFELTEIDSGRSVGSWTGDQGCYGPVHRGETRWPGITLTPGTSYLVTVTVEGQPSDGVLATGTGQATTSFTVTTPG